MPNPQSDNTYGSRLMYEGVPTMRKLVDSSINLITLAFGGLDYFVLEDLYEGFALITGHTHDGRSVKFCMAETSSLMGLYTFKKRFSLGGYTLLLGRSDTMYRLRYGSDWKLVRNGVMATQWVFRGGLRTGTANNEKHRAWGAAIDPIRTYTFSATDAGVRSVYNTALKDASVPIRPFVTYDLTGTGDVSFNMDFVSPSDYVEFSASSV